MGEAYPPGSKSVALQLGVHLILLYFIRISLLSAETFFLFGGWWMVGGGQGPTSWSFNFFILVGGGWWMVGGLPLFGSSHHLIFI